MTYPNLYCTWRLSRTPLSVAYMPFFGHTALLQFSLRFNTSALRISAFSSLASLPVPPRTPLLICRAVRNPASLAAPHAVATLHSSVAHAYAYNDTPHSLIPPLYSALFSLAVCHTLVVGWHHVPLFSASLRSTLVCSSLSLDSLCSTLGFHLSGLSAALAFSHRCALSTTTHVFSPHWTSQQECHFPSLSPPLLCSSHACTSFPLLSHTHAISPHCILFVHFGKIYYQHTFLFCPNTLHLHLWVHASGIHTHHVA